MPEPIAIGNKTFYHIFTGGDYPQGNLNASDIAEIQRRYSPLDFHAAPFVIGHPDFNWEDPVAYGWVGELLVQGDMLYTWFDSISDEAKKLFNGDYFRYCSVDIRWFLDETTKQLFPYLYSLGMTNAPAVKGMHPMKFSETDKAKYKFRKDGFQKTMQFENQSQTNNQILMRKYLEQLAAKFKIETAGKTDEQLQTEITAAAETTVNSNAALASKVATFKDVKPEDVSHIKHLQEEVASIKLKARTSLIDNAIASGKIESTQKDSMMKFAESNLDECEKFISSLKPSALFKQDATRTDTSKIAGNIDITAAKFKDGDGKVITFEMLMEKPELTKKFTQEEINALEAKYKEALDA